MEKEICSVKDCTIDIPERSDWQCYCFGSSDTDGIVWTPEKDKEPSWFWRKMQYLCFGNKWERVK
jgi:hypothetical protein